MRCSSALRDAGLKVREVPIEFVDRRKGDSKLDFQSAWPRATGGSSRPGGKDSALDAHDYGLERILRLADSSALGQAQETAAARDLHDHHGQGADVDSSMRATSFEVRFLALVELGAGDGELLPLRCFSWKSPSA